MIVTYIKGGVDVTEQIDVRVKSNGVGGDNNSSKLNEKEKERGEESQHASRSSRRIQQGVGAGVKSARLGCVMRAPFLRQSPSPSVGVCNLSGSLAMVSTTTSSAPTTMPSSIPSVSSFTSSTSIPLSSSSFSLGGSGALSSSTTIPTAVAAVTSSIVFDDRTAVTVRHQDHHAPDSSPPQPMLTIYTGNGDEVSVQSHECVMMRSSKVVFY